MINCVANQDNISASSCEARYGAIVKFYADEMSTGMAFSNALAEANWTSKINAASGSKMFIPCLKNIADEIEHDFAEAVTKTTTTGKLSKSRNGYDTYVFVYENITVEAADKLQSFDGADMYIWLVSKGGYNICKKNDTNYLPVSGTIFVNKFQSNVNDDGYSNVKISVRINETQNYMQTAIKPGDMDFSALDLQGIKDVEFSVISSDVSDGKVIFSVAGVPDGEEISALTIHGDFLVQLTSSGAVLTTTAVTYSSSTNRYELSVTGLTAAAHTITLKNQPSMTTKGYECQTPVSFTPVA